ncbi:MAG TPA: ATP-dependent sacrificial sulfur transferase LarE [Candidatus Nanoarchaeia archaeon]|nr:ATP-dependent sacrificial sulfur transferase LarE [Candidatus Nanoarchaeia archaeon]
METELMKKYGNLKESLRSIGNAIVAFSGGVDSALVLKVAHDILGENAIGVTADSPSLPRKELELAKLIAKEIGARHIVIRTKETENEQYLSNPKNRCYFCKSELYSKLKEACSELGIKNMLNGTNLDDTKDYRPGLIAADENKIISPLKDAGFTKEDVRILAKEIGLTVWEKPSSPCLSSRIPYGQKVTLQKLRMIELAEDFVKSSFGIKELRVRHFGKAARLEVNENNKSVVEENLSIIKNKFNEIGFEEIEITNFKSGILNLTIKSG